MQAYLLRRSAVLLLAPVLFMLAGCLGGSTAVPKTQQQPTLQLPWASYGGNAGNSYSCSALGPSAVGKVEEFAIGAALGEPVFGPDGLIVLPGAKAVIGVRHGIEAWRVEIPGGSVGHLSVDATGNIYCLSNQPIFTDPLDYIDSIVCISPAGVVLWQVDLPGPVEKMVVGRDGSVYCFGIDYRLLEQDMYPGTSLGYIAAFNADGTERWWLEDMYYCAGLLLTDEGELIAGVGTFSVLDLQLIPVQAKQPARKSVQQGVHSGPLLYFSLLKEDTPGVLSKVIDLGRQDLNGDANPLSSMALGPAGRIYHKQGYYEVVCRNINGNVLWAWSDPDIRWGGLTIAPNGDVAVLAWGDMDDPGTLIYVAGDTGIEAWRHSLGTRTQGVAVCDGAGNIYTASGDNLEVLSFDPLGNLRWSRGYRDEIADQVRQLAIGPDGGLWASAYPRYAYVDEAWTQVSEGGTLVSFGSQ